MRNFYHSKPEGCNPGVEGCGVCKYKECVYNGPPLKGEVPQTQKKTVTAVTVTATVKRFAKYSTSHYSTFPRRVNSIFTQNNLESILV